MVKISAKLPTKNLPIRRVMARLFQSFVYRQLDDREHEGYRHPNGKVFKAMNFKIAYHDSVIEIKYSALDKKHEKAIAMAVLKEGLKLGEVHIVSAEVSLEDRAKLREEKLKVAGFVAANIKDGTSSKKIYLEPSSHKFQEIIHNNTLQKYEALMGSVYEGELKITMRSQKPDARYFHYNKARIKAWHAIYEIEADSEMMEMILDTGLGAHAMQGLGYVEVV